MTRRKINGCKRSEKLLLGLFVLLAATILIGLSAPEGSLSLESISFGNGITGAAIGLQDPLVEETIVEEIVVPEEPLVEEPIVIGPELIPEVEDIPEQQSVQVHEDIGTQAACSSWPCNCGDTITASITIGGNLDCTDDGLVVAASNIVIDCAGYNLSGDGGSGDYGIDQTSAYNNVTIQNCNFYNFGRHIYVAGGSQAGVIENNIFVGSSNTYGIFLDDGDYWNVTNNNFSGTFATSAIRFDSNSPGNRFWRNIFNDDKGFSFQATSEDQQDFCVTGYGNFYNSSVQVTSLDEGVIPTDCGPTPNGSIYVNESLTSPIIDWGGNATYVSDMGTALRIANSTVYMLTNNTITGFYSSYGMYTTRSNVEIDCQGFTIMPTTPDTTTQRGLRVFDTGISIHDCVFDNFYYSIYAVTAGSQANIFNNSFTASSASHRAIYLDDGDYWNISHNNFSGSYTTDAIYFDGNCVGNNFWGNIFNDDKGFGFQAGSQSSQNFCVNGYGNFYNGSVTLVGVLPADCGPAPTGTIYVNDTATQEINWGVNATTTSIQSGIYNSNNTIEVSVGSGPYLEATESVRNFTILNCNGVTLQGSGADDGLYINGERNFVVNNCTFDNFNYGIKTQTATNNLIANCTFLNNDNAGIYLYYGSSYNIITSNNVSLNDDYGVWLDSSTGANQVLYNNITLNHIESNVDYGVHSDANAQNNLVYKNNFINNTLGSIQSYSESSTNDFNLSTLGNYWGDFDEVGEGCNPVGSVCDSPYNLTGSGSNKDYYPSTSLIVFGEETPIGVILTECGNLTTQGENYTLANNVNSTETCFRIMNHSITLDCAGYAINFSTLGTSASRAVYISGYDNIIVRNCLIYEGNNSGSSKDGIYLANTENSSITNNTISLIGSSMDGVYITSSINTNITYNNITTMGTTSSGIYLWSSSTQILISDNTILTSGPDGIAVRESNWTKLTNNNITLLYNSTMGYGINLLNAKITNLSQNIVVTNNTPAFFMSLSGTPNPDYYNLTLENTNLFNGFPILYNHSISNTVVIENINLENTYSQLLCVSCNNITYNNVTLGKDGISIYNSTNVTIRNSTISNTNGHGIYVYTSPFGTISNNFINKSSLKSSTYGINLFSGTNWTISGNTIYYYSSSSSAGIYTSNPQNDYVIVENNVVDNYPLVNDNPTKGIFLNSNSAPGPFMGRVINNTVNISNGYGIYTNTFGKYIEIKNNTLTSSNYSNIYLVSGSYFDIENNVFNTRSSNGIIFNIIDYSNITNNIFNHIDGDLPLINFTGGSGGNYLTNNIVHSNNNVVISDNTGGSEYNILIYNNSFGNIRWNSTNLTTNINLSVGETIFLENNKVGLIDNGNTLNLNSSAIITFYNLGYSLTPQLLKNGVRCDDSDDCNISYSTSILYANVSSFSNYTTQESPPVITIANSTSCGYVNNNITLTTNVTSTGTCFNINSSNVIIDCNGSNVNYSTSGTLGYSVNNTAGFDNLTIKNCNIYEGNISTNNKIAIYLSNSNNCQMINNSINTYGSGAYGIYALSNNNLVVGNNSILTNLSTGIYVHSLTNNVSIINNNVSSLGGTSDAIFVNVKDSIFNIATNVSISNNLLNGEYFAIHLSFGGENILVYNNNISSDGTYLSFTNGVNVSNNNVSGSNSILSSDNNHFEGNSFHHILYLDSGSNNNSLVNNNFSCAAWACDTNLDLDGDNNTFTLNSFSDAYNEAINLASSGNTFTDNNITSPNDGILISNPITNNSYINNYFAVSRIAISGTIINNGFVYNNSYGEIQWTSENITTNFSALRIGAEIFLENNTIGLIDNSSALSLNGSAQITFYGLSYLVQPNLLKNGIRCDEADACNITSYDNTTGTLVAQVSSFSNYTTQDSMVDNSPNVTLVSPAASYINDSAATTEINFSCNATDDIQLQNISLYLTNSTNQSFVLNQTTNITGISNSSSWSLNLTTGSYTWGCLAYDNTSQSDWDINGTLYLSYITDAYPTWSNNATSIVATYSSSTESYFNITWQDDTSTSTIYFESNYSGTAANYTMNNITASIYNYSAILPAGTHYWKSYANDSANQWNETGQWNFTIAQISSEVNTTINNSESNISLAAGTTIDLNCTLITGESSVYLYNNGTLINSGTSPIGNSTLFSSEGLYNITCLYQSTQNYSASSETYWVNITQYPIVELINPAVSYTNNSAAIINVTFECNATDLTELQNISLYITDNTNSNFVLNQTTNISGTSNSSNWTLELSVGTYTWNCLAYDNLSQSNWADANRTITQNYAVAVATPAGSSSGGGGGGSLVVEIPDEVEEIAEEVKETPEELKEDNVVESPSGEKVAEDNLPLFGSAIALLPGFDTYLTYGGSFVLFVLLILVIVKLISLIRKRREIKHEIIHSKLPVREQIIKPGERPIVILKTKHKKTKIDQPSLKEEYDDVNQKLLQLEEERNKPIIKKEVKKKLKVDSYGIKELVLQRGLRKVDARLHGYPTRKPMVIKASEENIHLAKELDSVDQELTQVDKRIPKNIKVISRVPAKRKPYENKFLDRELNRVTSTLANSIKNPGLLLRNIFPQKKVKPVEKLVAERKARDEVIRISKKTEGKNPLPKNELQEVEEKLAKLRKRLEQ